MSGLVALNLAVAGPAHAGDAAVRDADRVAGRSAPAVSRAGRTRGVDCVHVVRDI